ncbi:MAG TPA: DUF4159 domain-containing protein [Gammaproteobacteria bacterium]
MSRIAPTVLVRLAMPAAVALTAAWTAGVRADGPAELLADPAEFVFARLHYDSVGGWGEAYYNYDGRTWERWETDYPQGDENFVHRLNELSSVKASLRGVARRITDEDVFEFPFLYMCDPGYLAMTAEEKARLREYLLAGGFLWIDDFWGEAEWWNVEGLMKDVLPGQSWREIPPDHPILHSVFDLTAAPQIPAQDFAVRGWKTDPGWVHRAPATDLQPVNFRGYFDAEGRLMAIATHNTDVGDGWEREAYGQWYFEKYSTQAYMIGVNVVVYAMSH